MKKTLLLKTMLLLCALIVGSSSTWADEVTFLASSDKGTISTNGAVSGGDQVTKDGITISSSNGPMGNSTDYRFYQNGTCTVSSTVGKITKIEITCTASGTSNYGPAKLSGTGYTYSGTKGTWQGTAAESVVLSATAQCRATQIVVTYTPAVSYTITPQSNNESYGTVSLSGNVITASPNSGYRYADPAYTVSPANSATVVQNGNNFTVTPSENTTVTINFEAIPTYTVTLGDDQSTLTETTAGAGVTLPTRSAIDEYTFAGWSETNVSTETTTAPTIIPAGAYYPTESITLYPVYTKTEGSGGTAHESTSVTIADYATANNWDNGVQYASVTLDKNVKASATGGGNTGKYYTSGNEWRFYQNEDAKVTISTTSGELKSVTFTFNINNGGTLNYGSSKITSGTAVDVSGTSAEFTVGNSGTAANGQIKITAISVNYDITGVGTTYYWSSPVASAVETPSIVVTDNPFLFSTTATITCATEGAAIKYSYDGTTWNDYTAALTITETKTIYAKAVKGEDVSSVAQVTATKNLAEATVTVSGDLTLDLDGGTDVNAGTLTAAVTYNSTAVEGATVTWSSNKPAVATIDETTGVVTIKTTGEVTFTATYAGNSDYAEATGTKTVTVTDSKAPGTENNPYTVAQARAAIDAGTGITGVYATGIVSKIVTAYSSEHGNISYNISADGLTTGDQLQAYRGKSYNGDEFTSEDDIQVGDIVVIKGNLTKYGSTYEFAADNQLISLVRPVTPIIVTTPASLTGFTYEVGNGPSEAKTFTVEGSNLEANISLSLGESSNFEMSTTEGSGYTNSLTLTQEAGAVASTTIYVRLKADLAVSASYEGTITLTSTNAENKSVSLAGSVTAPEGPNFTWDLSTDQTTTATTSEMTWVGTYATMAVAKGSATTNTNNYYPGTPNQNYTSTRFYKNSNLTITPVSGCTITSVEFTATTTGYASALEGSTWTNATAAVEGTTVTVIPTNGALPISATIGGTCGFTAVKVYYDATFVPATIPANKEWITFCSTANLDFSEAIEGLKGAYTITAHESQAITLTATEMTGTVKAGTGLLLRAAEKKDVDQVITIPVAATGDDQADNMLKGVTVDTEVQPTDGDYTNLGLSNGEFHPYSAAGTLAAGKAYLQVPTAQMPSGGNNAKLSIVFDGEATGIDNLNVNDNDNFDVNAPMYNLAGQRVTKSYKGVVIVNGKKVVRK